MPPTPIRSKRPAAALWNRCRTPVDSAKSGAPESPPVSSANFDRRFGRLTVVFDTMTPFSPYRATTSLIARAQRQFPTAASAVFLFDHAERPAYDGLFYPERGD